MYILNEVKSICFFSIAIILILFFHQGIAFGQAEQPIKKVSWGLAAGTNVGGIIHASSFSYHAGLYFRMSLNRTLNENIVVTIPIGLNNYSGLTFIPLQIGLKANTTNKKHTRLCIISGYGFGAFGNNSNQISNFDIQGGLCSEIYLERSFYLNSNLYFAIQVGLLNQRAVYKLQGVSGLYKETNNLSALTFSAALLMKS